MDVKQNGTSNVETIYCEHCGTLNNITNNYCINCGAMINGNTSQIQKTTSGDQISDSTKEKNKKELLILFGIISFIISLFVENAWIIIFIAGIASLFSKKTRPYGLTILIAIGVIIAIQVILFIIFFGVCFAVLGGFS